MSFDIKFIRQALRTLVESRGLPSNLTCTLKAEQGKVETYYIYQFTNRFTLQATCSDYDLIIDLRIDSMSPTASLKMQRHDDLIRYMHMRKTTIIRSICNNTAYIIREVTDNRCYYSPD